MFPSFSQMYTDLHLALLFSFLYRTAFLWIPSILMVILANVWLKYRRALFFAKQKYVLLEVKLPKEIFKSPLSMELFFNSLYQTGGEGTWYDVYWSGQTRPWFSLELVSIDGGIHFFIWTRKGMRNNIESTLYSQVPGIEIYESADYTLPVTFDPAKMGMWASEFELTKPDPLPIKTYIDYGMDKDPKEEYKIDPMTPLIEFLGSLGRGHQAWIQIIIRAHKAEDKDPSGSGKLVDLKWAKAAEAEIKKILDKTKGEKDADGKEKPGRRETQMEKDVINAIERSISKIPFDVGIRALLFAPKDIFTPDNIAGIVGGFRNYNSNHLNGFKPARTAGGKYNFWWQKEYFNKKDIIEEKENLLDAYKKRAYFYNEHAYPYFVLNTEELATIYHFPGGVSATPTFTRIGSKKAEAPPNLPL